MEKRKAIFALLITVFIWNSSFAVIKIGLQEIEPLILSFIRSSIASVFLFMIIVIKN